MATDVAEHRRGPAPSRPPNPMPAEAVAARRPRIRMHDRGVPGLLRRVLLAGASTALAVASAEGVFRAADIDGRLVTRALYYQGVDGHLHRESTLADVHYELIPSHTGLTEAGSVPVRVDRYGARGAEHPEPKGPGVFRILFFGASTLYGAGVRDEETLAARLEQTLNQPAPDAAAMGARRRFEVWNFGTSAYVLSQMCARAVVESQKHAPDLILVLYSNRGRRAFLDSAGFRAGGWRRWFERDPRLWAEYFPQPAQVDAASWTRCLQSWALCRSVVGWRESRQPGHPQGYAEAERRDVENASALRRFGADRGVPVVFVLVAPLEGKLQWRAILPELDPRQLVDLFRPDKAEAWRDLHPRAPVLLEQARFLGEELGRRGFLGHPPPAGPASGPPGRPPERAR